MRKNINFNIFDDGNLNCCQQSDPLIIRILETKFDHCFVFVSKSMVIITRPKRITIKIILYSKLKFRLGINAIFPMEILSAN